ncbi:hypothetical protein AK812_SmicGene49056 [Symbiodinium microadriaticum]|uniref:Uncharacterized protein n=1 Tax=Symbiodinium microadriaticum TaxID=2951 RepID=A0A1Q9E5F7_SYMMI|nr:hypothetical protein AK812_SmicGene49056 [Symbiodinium microadriaticum]
MTFGTMRSDEYGLVTLDGGFLKQLAVARRRRGISEKLAAVGPCKAGTRVCQCSFLHLLRRIARAFAATDVRTRPVANASATVTWCALRI